MFGFWKKKASTAPIGNVPVQGASAAQTEKPRPVHRAQAIPSLPLDGAPSDGTLRETDLAALYNLGTVNVLEPEAVLFRAEDPAGKVHMLVKGEVALRDGAGSTLARAASGNWIGHLNGPESRGHACSAVALTPASVLSLDRSTYEGLDHELKLRVLTQMQTRQQALTLALATRNKELHERARALEEALYRSRPTTDSDLSRTDTVRQIIQKVPRLPVSTTTLLGKLFDEDSTNAEIVELVKSDPSLTSTLLRAINSPLYGLQHQITHVNHAVTLLGFEGVHQLVLAESMRKSLPETPEFEETHRRALETSQLAFAAAQATGVSHPAEVATIGLLHEIGTVVLELLKTENPHLDVVLATVNTAGMGAELLRSWNLPEQLCRSIELQHYPGFAPPAQVPENVLKNVTLLYLGKRMREHLHSAGTDIAAWPFAEDYLGTLGITEADEWNFFRQKVRPALMGRLKALPKSLAEALSS